MCRKYYNTLGKWQHVTRYLIFTVLVKVQYITQFITWICVITLLRMTFTALKCNIWAATAQRKLVNLSIIRSYWHSVLNRNIILKYITPCVFRKKLPQMKSIYILHHMVLDLSTQHQKILTMFDEIMRLDLIAYVGSPLRYGNDASFTTNAFSVYRDSSLKMRQIEKWVRPVFLENNDRRVDVITSLYGYLHNFAWVG